MYIPSEDPKLLVLRNPPNYVDSQMLIIKLEVPYDFQLGCENLEFETEELTNKKENITEHFC